ncbi:DUF1799 domain-containing protein [Brucella intermedia]|uniref:DUF1799 domain-containing protein n=1 Tax=Brucella intermedia TaxID=94625 RepID=UPI00235E162F|nr:DUF1799 domain-containing protein [Brucella intermedia]
MGVSVEVTPDGAEADGAFHVWRENEEALIAWLAVETQWRIVSTMAGLIWLGLDYSAVDVVLRRLKSPDHVFADLQNMELAALEAFNEALA